MTIKKRLARANIAMLAIPIFTAAVLLLLGLGAAVLLLRGNLFTLHGAMEQIESVLHGFKRTLLVFAAVAAALLLDLMLPGMDGFTVCRKVREVKDIPILMVTALGKDVDKIRGLGYGADDYIEKPFSPSVLVARIKAHLAQYRHLKPPAEETATLTAGILSADTACRRVTKNGVEITLKNKEYELLLFLMCHPGQVFSREDLYEMIWGLESMGDNITVAVHMKRLRERIEDDPAHPQLLQTVWGVGYRLSV